MDPSFVHCYKTLQKFGWIPLKQFQTFNKCSHAHFYSSIGQNDIVVFVNVFWRHSRFWSSSTWCVFDTCPASPEFIYSKPHRKVMSRLMLGQSSHEFPSKFSLPKKLNHTMNSNFGHFSLSKQRINVRMT